MKRIMYLLGRTLPVLAVGVLVGQLFLVSTTSALAFCTGAAGEVPGTSCKPSLSVTDGVNAAQGKDVPTKLTGDGGMFNTIVNILLFIIGAVAVIMLIIGGIRYVTSNGDQAHVKAAKDTILYAIIGLIVAILAFAIVNFVVTSVK